MKRLWQAIFKTSEGGIQYSKIIVDAEREDEALSKAKEFRAKYKNMFPFPIESVVPLAKEEIPGVFLLH